MNEITADNFRKNLKSEADKVANSHEVLRVTRRKGEDFMVISASDWNAIEQTLYLNQIPGMVNSIQEAAKEHLSEGTELENLNW